MSNSKQSSLIGGKNPIKTTNTKEKNKTILGAISLIVISLVCTSIYIYVDDSYKSELATENITVAEHAEFPPETPDEFPKEKIKAIMSVTSNIDLTKKENQYQLGMKYLLGEGVERNYQEAIGWFTLAAKQEHREAQGMLGQIYHQGELVPRNDKQALIWSILAASKGLKEAQYTLGLIYEEGRGIKANEKEALKWFTMAANQGMLRSQEKVVKYKNTKNSIVNDSTQNKHSPARVLTKDDLSEVEKYLSTVQRKNNTLNKEGNSREIIWD